jgi:hypothetical protein
LVPDDTGMQERVKPLLTVPKVKWPLEPTAAEVYIVP